MKIFEWIKSLFKKKEEKPIVTEEFPINVARVEEPKQQEVAPETKPTKKKKRGRPRKKKVEQK